MAELEDIFEILARLTTSANVQVRRARRRADGLSVVLKSSGAAIPSDDEVGRMRHEYAILETLREQVPQPGVVKPVMWWEHAMRPTLVLADIGGTALGQLFTQGPCEPAQVLNIGRQVIASLDRVHKAGVLHKDINPRNLVYNQGTDLVEIIDFNVAIHLDAEVKSVAANQAQEGTLAYAPPEQIGRLSRSADARTDYYSLGATLYELATGHLPFDADDPSALTHQILTAVPPWPSERNPAVPEMLSRILMKLLEKTQEGRYQSARGIDADLQRCQEALQTATSVTFDLGQDDRTERFSLPQRLYGRDPELAMLRQALADATRSRRVLVLLGGPSGMGKSALVTELQTEMAGANALFAAGKYDQLRRHLPFSALSQALEALIRGFLFTSRATVEAWRRRVQGALGAIGQAVVDVIPAVELLVGKQAPAAPLASQETENRLHLLLQRMISALAERMPLVLFLDDLQWADPGTIKFLHGLTYSPQPVAGLLAIAAYRNDEVAPEHPLAQLILTLQDEQADFRMITLSALGTDATVEYVRAATLAKEDAARQLGEVVHNKTGGNPFFMREYLRHLHREGLLKHDPAGQCWMWDVDAVINTSATANVVTLLTAKLRDQSPDAQRTLALAACLGNEFHLKDLEQVSDTPRAALTAALNEAVSLQLLIPMTPTYRYAGHTHSDEVYKFSHDRVQQAAAGLASAEDAERDHARIGAYLRGRLDHSDTNVNVFAVLGHLNAATNLVTEHTARVDLARLNLTGAREAKRAGAFEIALDYLNTALKMLGEQAWEIEAELTRYINIELADNEFLSGALTTASERLNQVAMRTPDLLDRVEVEARRVYALTAAGRMDEALHCGVEALRLVGVYLPHKPTKFYIAFRAISLFIALGIRKVDDLPFLPRATERRWHLLFELLASVNLPAYYTDANMFALLAVVAPRLTIKYGVTRLTSYTVGIVALVFVQINQYAAAKRLAVVTRHSMVVHPDGSYHAPIEMCATTFIEYVMLAPQALIDQTKRAYEVGLETGDPLFAGWSAIFCAITPLWVSTARASREIAAYRDYIARRNEKNQTLVMREVEIIHATLLGNMTFDAYMKDPVHARAALQKSTGAAIYMCLHVPVLWLWGAYQACWQAVCDGRAWALFDLSVEQIVPAYCFFGGLAYCTLLGKGTRFGIIDRLWFLRMRMKLRAVAKAGPEMYGGLALVVDAAHAAARGRHQKATALFEKALSAFSRSEYTNYVAATYECVGRHWASLGKPYAARGYLQMACDLYRAWGAEGKLEDLRQEFREILGDHSRSANHTHTLTSADLSGRTKTSTRTTTSSSTTTGTLGSDINMEAWRSLAQALTEGMSRSDLLSVAVVALREASAATRALIALEEEDGSEVVDSHAGQPLPDQILAYVRRTRDTFSFEDLMSAPQMARDPYVQLAQPRSLACIPMMHKGQLKGVIYLENNITRGVFTQARVTVLALFAPQIALALDNSKFYSKLEAMAATQTEELQRTQARLLVLERESTEAQMAGGFAHEMRNALSAVSYPLPTLAHTQHYPATRVMPLQTLNTELLDNLERASTPEERAGIIAELRDNNLAMQDAVDNMAAGVKRGVSITQQILDYAHASHIVVGSDQTDLSALVNTVLAEHKQSMEAHHIDVLLQVHIKSRVMISEPHAYAIVRNLIANARDAVAMKSEESPRRIEVEVREAASRVHVSVRDTGVGITEEAAKRVFQPFFTTKGTEGTGLGLGLSRKLAAAYGGSLTFTSQPGQGTTFQVELPTGNDK